MMKGHEPNAVRYIGWAGIDRRGNARCGSTTVESPAELAERLYQSGFRSATVTDTCGRVCGFVRRVEGRRARTWRGEAL